MGSLAAWRKPAIGAGVLALHALAIIALVRMGLSLPPQTAEAQRETIITLLPLTPPRVVAPVAQAPAKKEKPAPSWITTIPRAITLPPQTGEPPGTSLPGLGASLGCGASGYDSLSAEQRAACNRGPWHYDARARETASLIIKAPPPGMSAADRAERIRDTVDPCAAEKLTHQTDCIYKVIYGNKLP